MDHSLKEINQHRHGKRDKSSKQCYCLPQLNCLQRAGLSISLFYRHKKFVTRHEAGDKTTVVPSRVTISESVPLTHLYKNKHHQTELKKQVRQRGNGSFADHSNGSQIHQNNSSLEVYLSVCLRGTPSREPVKGSASGSIQGHMKQGIYKKKCIFHNFAENLSQTMLVQQESALIQSTVQ